MDACRQLRGRDGRRAADDDQQSERGRASGHNDAIARLPPREIALLMAEATPELRTGTLVMSAVVRGATIIARPSPKTTCPGKKSMKYSTGGIQVVRSLGLNIHAGLVAGVRRNHRMPSAMSAGPAVMKKRGPRRAARAPKRVERSTRRRPPGMPARPAADAE